MTLPVSGTISIGDLNTESGVAATTNKGLSWLNGNLKSFNGTYNFTQSYGKTWYQKNNAYFNCTMDNRDSQCNCNNCATSQCAQCLGTNVGFGWSQCGAYSACANCACDNKGWLQANCNCGNFQNCAYNCAFVYATNCNCACRC